MVCIGSSPEGRVAAQIYLAQCLQGGGVKKDAEAAVWFAKAAEKGNMLAQYCLGECYTNGTGVVANVKEAVKWYRKSAELGFRRAEYELGACYATGEGVDKDDKLSAF